MDPLELLEPDFYHRDAKRVAADLLGRYVVRELDGQPMILEIVETEAYLGARDRASHAWNDRRTRRTRALFRAGGFAYVYLVYGMHHCLNAVTGSELDGSAVLLRAGEPIAGIERMVALRRLHGAVQAGQIAGGPGKLCQALAVGLELNGASLFDDPLRITWGRPVGRGRVCTAPRIGVKYAGQAAKWKLRFAVEGNEHVSKPWPWI